MAIKDKNGNVYKLRGPNPVMKSQEFWDPSKIILHNMQFRTITRADHRPSMPESIETPQPEPITPEVDNSDITPIVERAAPIIAQDDKIARMLAEKKVTFHCLPATYQFQDDFYGEQTGRLSFGTKFEFPGIIVKWDDLQIIFWTDREITKNSIVFPTRLEMKRWWQIQEIQPKSGGYMLRGTPSSASPDFS